MGMVARSHSVNRVWRRSLPCRTNGTDRAALVVMSQGPVIALKAVVRSAAAATVGRCYSVVTVLDN